MMKSRYVKLHIKKIHSLNEYVCDYAEYIDEKYLSMNNVYMYHLNKDGFYSHNDSKYIVVYFDLNNDRIKDDPSYLAFIKYKQVIRLKKLERIING